MRTAFLTFFLISSVACATSKLLELKSFFNTTAVGIPGVLNGSTIYLASSDKAARLGRITIYSNKTEITLNMLLGKLDEHAFQIGWPVNEDLMISTSNTQEVTNALLGSLFIATPTMSADPNFKVKVVVGSSNIDRSSSDNSTIVLFNVRTANSNGTPAYMGFTHTRVENIVQPRETSLSFYSGQPDDNYGNLTNADTLKKRIFSNPLQITTSDSGVAKFFENIDPIQYAGHVWVVSSRGGVSMDVSDTYVDTTNINSNQTTVTGMSNSQLFTYNSSVTFLSSGDNLGMSGIMVRTELFDTSNITIMINGQKDRTAGVLEMKTDDSNNEFSVQWPAENMQIYPSSAFAGIYFIQYFKIDEGPAPTTSRPSTAAPTKPPTQPATQPAAQGTTTTAAPPAPSSSTNGASTSVTSASPKFSSSVAPVSSTPETTTKSVAIFSITLPVLLALLSSLLLV